MISPVTGVVVVAHSTRAARARGTRAVVVCQADLRAVLRRALRPAMLWPAN
jgi:hypothetical protein